MNWLRDKWENFIETISVWADKERSDVEILKDAEFEMLNVSKAQRTISNCMKKIAENEEEITRTMEKILVLQEELYNLYYEEIHAKQEKKC